ncbi:hypothetical protein DDM87_01390 [Vibrio cholerae]|nr:hypothetical protein [Vibrio cholerae]
MLATFVYPKPYSLPMLLGMLSFARYLRLSCLGMAKIGWFYTSQTDPNWLGTLWLIHPSRQSRQRKPAWIAPFSSKNAGHFFLGGLG